MEQSNVCRLVWKGRVKGFDMWKRSYPFVKRGKDEIFIEVYEFFDLEILRSIDEMEINAGYHLEYVEIPELSPKQISMYIYLGDVSQFSRVMNGTF